MYYLGASWSSGWDGGDIGGKGLGQVEGYPGRTWWRWIWWSRKWGNFLQWATLWRWKYFAFTRGSGGGGFISDTSGGGSSGAIRLVSSAKIVVNGLIRAVGGGGLVALREVLGVPYILKVQMYIWIQIQCLMFRVVPMVAVVEEFL